MYIEAIRAYVRPFTIGFLGKSKRTMLREQNELLKRMVDEYRNAWIETTKELTKCSEANAEMFLSLIEQPRCEEWGLLHTLCQVLEANGTEFEPDSVLSNWWLENKGG